MKKPDLEAQITNNTKIIQNKEPKKNLHLKKIKKRRYNHQANTIVVGVGIVKNEQSRNQPQVRHNQSTNQAYKPTPKCRPFNRPRKNNSNRAHAPHNPPQCIHPQERSVREQDQNQTGADQRFEVGGGGSIKKRANATHIQKKRHAIGRGGGETSRSSLDRSERRRRQRRRRRRRRANGGMRRRRVKRRY